MYRWPDLMGMEKLGHIEFAVTTGNPNADNY